ncbi:fimbrial biogenesis outer membrane usher protein [Vibrio atlanticus]|uniref:fimbria/pilus outer membrane usher protein n=1 Tax=Vibrio TaxID=662 RepID=UPI0002F1E945|nr:MULTISPECIES: fimbria/pilus outer membrane usher protein [Vibrio]MBY7662247.1 fimbrial biogenesis outer membrane usher protein [Vibrio atlanticus]MBE8604675.1 fimbrial biogenesis outer membrane usher protein [Vibrio sp. OPT10]MDH5881364.1 fimbria/pilus outer membrane usher protein [Vibrio sp. S/42/10]NOH20354.1 fimbrial biogenesis outer membrane usher protein [Vibrio cyclitrophicus]OED80857.1 fimbrial protein [Vibrio cyclitrophicus ZF65]
MVLNPTGRDIQLTSLLRISDTILGEADIIITANNEILLPKESTLTLLSSVVTQEGINKLSNTTDNEMLSQHQFELVGLGLSFDFSSLECIVTVPPEFSLTQQLSMNGANDFYNYAEPSMFSGYINLALSANESQYIDQNSSRQDLYRSQFDSALNIGFLNFEYESYLENGSSQESRYIREGSRLNIDFAEQGTRLVLGDMYNSGQSFQDSTDILGIGLTRDFTLIPTRNARPRANQSFTLQRASNVDVYIDGIAVQRLTLGAGSYNLSDIPLAQGSNDIVLVITDRSGNEERIEFSIATGNDLLNSGEFEYSIMYGAPSELQNGQIEYLTDERILHGYIDVGINPWLTLGTNFQSREDLYQYGATALVASTWGVTEFNASRSEHPTFGTGDAYKFAFDAEFSSANTLTPQLSVSYEYLTNNFTGVTGFDASNVDINLTTHFASAFGSIYLGQSLRAAMTLNYRTGVDEENDYWLISPSLSAGLFDTPATWSARLSYQHNATEDDDISTTVTISWPLSRQTRVVGRYTTELNEAALDYSYQNNIGNTGGISGFASIVTNEETDADMDAGINYTANRYELNATHASRLEDISGETRNHSTDVTISSALAFAGSSVTIGRPVREAFAIVSKHKSLKENDVAIDPTKDAEYARVYLRGDGNAMVPDLVAYNGQVIGYEVDNLPPGYDLGDGAFWVKPGYKQGYQLQIGSDAVLTVIGKLFDRQSNNPISLVAGVAHYLGEAKQLPIDFFTNRNGIFAISGLKPGKYQLVLDTKGQESVIITLSERSDNLIRLGDVYVE